MVPLKLLRAQVLVDLVVGHLGVVHADLRRTEDTRRRTCMQRRKNQCLGIAGKTPTLAPSAISPRHTSIAGVSRVSPVSFLKAKPKIAIFFFEMVLNMALITRSTNRCFWKSFMRMT